MLPYTYKFNFNIHHFESFKGREGLWLKISLVHLKREVGQDLKLKFHESENLNFKAVVAEILISTIRIWAEI